MLVFFGYYDIILDMKLRHGGDLHDTTTRYKDTEIQKRLIWL